MLQRIISSPLRSPSAVKPVYGHLLKRTLASTLVLQNEDKKQTVLQLKTPKGTKDYNDKETKVRQSLFDTITRIFQRHGGVTIDTPVFELSSILSGKYGEDSKLIYDLSDQGGEACSLRYDLTVPFARYVAMHQIQQMKRYQLAKVYRRDQPNMRKGRLREFYQCDFDIAGQYDPMIPDAEVLKILNDTLDALEIPFYLKLNHRQILDGIFEICGVRPEHIRAVSAAVDKLDKVPWTVVEQEILQKTTATTDVTSKTVAGKIQHYVQFLSELPTTDLVETLERDDAFLKHSGAMKGLADIKLLLEYLDVYQMRDRVKLDLSLARGLDYYTGVIYEAIAEPSEGVGSIAAGGRYDHLVGMFSNSKKTIPCVGVSLGVERIFSILMSRLNMQEVKSNATQVYVISVGDGFLKERMALAQELWKAGINATFMYKKKPKLEKQWIACEKDQIPYAVIIGQDELDRDQVRLKDMRTKIADQRGGSILARKDLIDELKQRLSRMEN
ncbi:histidyl-tRNA synthetase [Mycotypha africana]|uniref:histidyl-tRNA synthetase n=1 Tax=Mycotypha africana TaxID=64632 RepID=UPI0023014EC6|nr:histidyl-tRNA synthetase [Mycotypha africana]KAI8987546.1 histidyl-tRNA synthetase [Mycotypha africana]